MARILIIGGAGEFGSRLARRLDASGHEVVVGGRSAARAAAFADTLTHGRAVMIDRERGAGLVIARERPAIVIDAAGPFQRSDYRVPEACIAMRVPYLDLADGRHFVTGIGALDASARAAGVPVIAGASSVPALSGAVVRHLAAGLSHIDAIDITIATSNRASAGEAVARSILSYVGHPIRLWNGSAWATGHGWQSLRRISARIDGVAPVAKRLVALADVPDLDILPDTLPGRPAVRFQAGTELDIQMLALWLMSWPVRWGWIRSVESMAGRLMPIYRALLRFGSDRSAMMVELRAGALTRRWTLIAEHGNGPEIPTMAAELIVGDMLAGRCASGARHAGCELTIERFAPLFDRYAIHRAVTEEVAARPAGTQKGRPVAGPPPNNTINDVSAKKAA